MGYSRNGQDFVNTLCEVAYGNTSNDKRTRADINTSRFWFNGGSRADNYPDAQFISYVSGFRYSTEALGGAYGGWPTFQRKEYQVSAKGYRPYSKYRYSQNTAGTFFIKKASSGQVFLTTSASGSTGTEIAPASLNCQYMFACMCAGGGGGGSASLTASAGGGGGGAYSWLLFKPGLFNRFIVGSGGSGGSDAGNGSTGADTVFEAWSSYSSYASGAEHGGMVSLGAGGGGYGGGNNSGGGGAAGYPTVKTDLNYFYHYKWIWGAKGGARNESGGSSTANFTNYTPEAETITYFTGLGGSSGGSSGGGGGGACPLGNGGSGGNKAAGGNGDALGAGGGGAGYKAFNKLAGGSGAKGYVSLMY